MKKILVTFGTRPEAIKMAPLVIELKKHPRQFEVIVCVTGQHRHMLDQVLSIFEIKPDIDLNLMKPNQDLTTITSNVLRKIKNVLKKVKPDLVLVQGDTSTAMIVGLESYYQKIPVGHVEAGLRTYDRYNPFPEEVNRKILSAVAEFHFAPSCDAVECLLRERIDRERIFNTGNTSIDALLMVLSRLRPGMRTFNTDKKLILVTAHRRESFGKPFKNICEALLKIARNNDDVEIVYPVHLNPKVRKPVFSILGKCDRIHLIEPLEYDEFAFMMKKAYLILTDSGGVQEEAPALGKPVLVLRDTTERPEVVRSGAAKLIGTSADMIVKNVEKLLRTPKTYLRMSKSINPYGKGDAAKKITDVLKI
ncbi:non-hydrolyzing UDP-N-acetylglucosamine 2-epimerase [Candidatus Auribacterota bacterium]